MREVNFFIQKLQNFWRTALLFIIMLLLVIGLGYSFFGVTGLVWAGALGGLALFASTQIPSKMIMRMQGGRPLQPYEAPELTRLMQQLAQASQLRQTPKLFYIPTRQLNAFATGHKDDPAIAITHGLLEQLNWRELGGVLAHEISHIRHNDMQLKTFASVLHRLTRAFAFLGNILLIINLPLLFVEGATIPWLAIALLIAAPWLNTILLLAISRTREFEADLEAARITGDPMGLASALQKLNYFTQSVPTVWTPLRKVVIPRFLRTHPTTKERVRRLKELLPKTTQQIYYPEQSLRSPFERRSFWV
jgi:heat shock protein HtpX